MILKLNTSPRPETGTQLDAVELHFEHSSYAGNRSIPHPPHFWTIRRPARAPSKNSVISGVMAGIGLALDGIGSQLIADVRARRHTVGSDSAPLEIMDGIQGLMLNGWQG